jgi:hypothetical protein
VALTLYGPWALEVVFGKTNSGERFTISGSASADGIYDKRPLSVGIGSVPATVSSAAWNIMFEFSPFGFLDIGQIVPFVVGDWYESGIVRVATYTLKDSLVMALRADYPTQPNYAARPDHNQPALVVTCRSLDPSLHAGPPFVSPFDFTLPRETLAKFHRRRRDETPDPPTSHRPK